MKIPTRWLAACLSLLFFLVPSLAEAGSLIGPSPVSFESQYRLAQEAKRSEAAIKRLMSAAISIESGQGKAAWLDIAKRFDTRAAMLGFNSSFKNKVEYSLGVDAAKLKLVAKVIREVMASSPPKEDASKKKKNWIQVVYLSKSKQRAYTKAVRARFSKMGSDAAASRTHPGSFGSSLKTVGNTVVWNFHSKDFRWLTNMVTESRKLAEAHGGKVQF